MANTNLRMALNQFLETPFVKSIHELGTTNDTSNVLETPFVDAVVDILAKDRLDLTEEVENLLETPLAKAIVALHIGFRLYKILK